MKKLLSITMWLMLSVLAYAQQDVTRFLGIPVDGSKWEMIRKLKEKGFRYDSTSGLLEGEFNGRDVYVSVVTNNNKVYRIMVRDANASGESSIKIRFNRLCKQFANNSKYISLEDYTIPDDEDISYEITVHKKRYEASFYQRSMQLQGTSLLQQDVIVQVLKETFLKNLKEMGEELLENSSVTEAGKEVIELLKNWANSTETGEELIESLRTWADSTGNGETIELLKKTVDLIGEGIELESKTFLNRSVWFMILDFRGEYYICMFYDNKYNEANGEDL